MPQGKAAEAAGYSSPAVEASRLLRMPVILDAIKAMQAPTVAVALSTRDAILTRLARTAHKHHLCGDPQLEAIGLKADALSARLQGLDIQRVQVEQTELRIEMKMPAPEGYEDA